ncbi:Stress response protein nst1 [Metarhizium rileyi]|uniref:Stress response protein NST1 n=1 Tax=Metarhizium rileyi (strain RCEF 4871) TaxID=1649241 RepID=A0A5C6G7U1_METRR|nr:Stress response protein nst1 [Metarhizium rileyi]
MPATNQKPATPTPASPRSTAKYTNKDGSKFITVPKSTASDSSQPSTPTIATNSANLPPHLPTPDAPVQAVNRKKQKRRQKALAKAAAAEQAADGLPDPALTSQRPSEPFLDDQDIGVSDDEIEGVLNGHSGPAPKPKKSKKKKKKSAEESGNVDNSPAISTPVPQTASQDVSRPSGMSRDKIWSTSNHEERERIKEFWLGLGEDERKSLVKVEKDAVLKKMKEQQKHTCSCTVCGRKRTAIEEELEGLYDAYYLELEQFANHGDGPPMLQPPPRDFPPRPRRRLPSNYTPQQPSHGRIVEHVGNEDDEDELEEVYSEDDAEDDEFSDDEPPEQFHNPYDRDMTDFLAFGSSLQVKGTQLLEYLLSAYGNMDLGGILTVADDLLKNDGKRFIEMMEQLAERRMAREEDAREHFSRGYGHPNGSYSTPHNHPPPEDDDYEDEEDEEEDYEDSQDEEYEDEEDQMTEEQRMEEGRRMFQIFAARMFEQRVLSAYKEKVAKERQEKLLEELEEESRQVDQQKAKKAKNAQKKKDKAAQKKQALAEEKARKEAEKAAEEAARVEAEQKRIAEQRQKAEEKRKQKESQKRAEEEAKMKKEADRQRRIHEQREKQAEQERKAREAKERERRLKEEQRQRDKQARDRREREAQERKEKQERDKREKEARAAKAQKDLQEATQRAKDDKTAHHKTSVQATPSQPVQITKRGQGPIAVPLPTVLPQHPPNPASYASPKIPVATPAIPKAPTPIRSRALSQQQDSGPGSSTASQSASGPSQNPSPHLGTPVQASPVPVGPERKTSTSSSILAAHLNQPVSPHSIQTRLPSQTPPFQMPATMGLQPPPGLAQPRPPRFPSPISHEAVFPPMQFRPGPNMMMAPPGLNGPGSRVFPQGTVAPSGFNHASTDPFPMNQGFPMAKETPVPTHTRQGSTGYDVVAGASPQPIGRPAPIGRPGSLSQQQSREEDEDTKHLGSSALVADDDEPPLEELNPGGLRNQPPGPRGGFAASPFMDAVFPMGQNPWGPPAGAALGQPFAPPGFPNPTWGSPGLPPGFGMASPTLTMSSIRSSSQPRHAVVRSLICSACRDLSVSGSADADGFMDLGTIKSRVGIYVNDLVLTDQDLLNLCDTEGSDTNGGGTFDVKHDMSGVGQHRVRWNPDQSDAARHSYRAVGAPGEICSPRTEHSSLRSH